MSSDWLHSIKQRFLEDKVVPKSDLWDGISDDLWEQQLKNSFEGEQINPPSHLSEPILNAAKAIGSSAKMLTYSLYKWAVALIGIAGTGVISWFVYTSNKVKSLEQPTAAVDAEIPASLEAPLDSNSTYIKVLDSSFLGSQRTPLLYSKLEDSILAEALPISPEKVNIPDFYSVQEPKTLPVTTNETTDGLRLDVLGDSFTSADFRGRSWEYLPVSIAEWRQLEPTQQTKSSKQNAHTWAVGVGAYFRVAGPVNTKEGPNLKASHMPFQRWYGLEGVLQKGKWQLGLGLFQNKKSLDLQLTNVPFFKSPVRVIPQRKLVIVSSEIYKKPLDTEVGRFVPQGTRPDDTMNFYRINYRESLQVQAVELPISIGYQINAGRIRIIPTIGYSWLIPTKASSSLRVEILNPVGTVVELANEHDIDYKSYVLGYAQLGIQYRLFDDWYVSLLANKPYFENKLFWEPNRIRWQAGLFANF